MPVFNGSEGAPIATATAANYTAQFRASYPHNKRAYFVGVENINALLEQEGAVGIRIYLGENNIDGGLHIMPVLVAADSSGEDIIGICMDELNPCPPACSGGSPLEK